MSRFDVPVPQRARWLAGLRKIDYADAFAVDVAHQRSPRDWLRIVSERNAVQLAAVRVAHRALGLRLAPAGRTDHPLGWKIVHDDAHECVLAANGTTGDARLVAIATPTTFTLATLLDLNGLLGTALWFGVGVHGHRAVAPLILGNVPWLAVDA